MPKIIENVSEKVLFEAEKQVLELGYSNMTIRSVAKAVGIASGTVYNYFPSKEMMVATFMARDWATIMKNTSEKCKETEEYKEVLETVYAGIEEFMKRFSGLFTDPEAKSGFSTAYFSRRGTLIKQVSDLFEPVCKKKAGEYTPHLSEFIAESLMTWVVGNKDFDELYTITKQLFI